MGLGKLIIHCDNIDDCFKIVYNGTGKEEVVSLKEIKSSTMFSEASQEKSTAIAVLFSWLFFFNSTKTLIE